VEIVLALVVVAVVAWFVSVPLRRSAGETEAAAERLEDPRIAELDREQGKLSQSDWRRQDAQLRRDAIAILKELDQARSDAEARVGSKQ